MKITQRAQQTLKQFQSEIYHSFAKCQDVALSIIHALSSHHQASSVVKLSLSPFFERHYSRLYKGIAHCFGDTTASEVAVKQAQLVAFCRHLATAEAASPFYLLAIDTTANSRPDSQCVADVGCVYSPNRGIMPVVKGHEYASVCYIPSLSSAWCVGLKIARVASDAQKTTVGATQVTSLLTDTALPFCDKLCVIVGDTVYSQLGYVHPLNQSENAVTITRLRHNRVLYKRYEGVPKKKGRKKVYGDRFCLNDARTQGEADEVMCWEEKTARGRVFRWEVKGWQTCLQRGKRGLPMEKYPFTVYQVKVFDAQGKPVYKRPLWLAKHGERRAELDAKTSVTCFRQRSRIEGYFRFSKQNLLSDAFQTPEVAREETWWHLSMLAYQGLYLAKDLAAKLPYPWETYLPAYHGQAGECSPAMVQRDMARIIRAIGTPVKTVKPRNKGRGRRKGVKLTARKRHPLIKKQKKRRNRA